jgi:DNA polymerase-4
MAEEIRQTIYHELELTASAGIAPVKFLAKIASDMNKPNGQFVIAPHQVAEFVRTLPLAKIPGVGKSRPQSWKAWGCVPAKMCRKATWRCCSAVLKFGRILWERSQGIDEREINNTRQRKSVGVERTLVEISTSGLPVRASLRTSIRSWSGGC